MMKLRLRIPNVFLLLGMVLCSYVSFARESRIFADSSKNPIDTNYVPGNLGLERRPGVLKSDQFIPGNRYNPLQLIQGKLPGVTIARPGGDPNAPFNLQIRGLHSAIYSGFAFSPNSPYNQQINNTQALVVVDGIPGLALNSVDPQDIASIEVLRDAASLAAYGMRGANGVILIQTKRGQQQGSHLEYNAYVALDAASNPYEGIDAATFRQLTGNGGKYQGVATNLGSNTDWYDLITRSGFSQAHNLALQKGNEASNYRLALNYRSVEGIAKKSGFDQLNALFNFNRSGKTFKLDGLFAINSRSSTEVTPDVFRNATIMNPTAPARQDTARSTGGYFQPLVFSLFNPLALLEQTTAESNTQHLTAGLNGTWEVVKNVSLQANLGYQRTLERYGWAMAPNHVYNRNPVGDASWEEQSLNHGYLNLGLTHRWIQQQHQLNTRLGYGYQIWDGRNLLRDGSQFNNQVPTYQPLASNDWRSRSWTVEERSSRDSDEMLSMYLQSEYRLNDRWFARGSLRREGFTRLGTNKWVVYPAFSAGGDLIQDGKILNQLRIQVGYGVTGNIPPKSYATELLIRPGANTLINGTFQPGIFYPYAPNPNLRAETRRELNIALDFALLNQRIQGQIQVYQSRSSDLLWGFRLREEQLFSNLFFDNVLALENRGVEVQLNVNAIQTQQLQWQSNLSLSRNQTTMDAPFPVSNSFEDPNRQFVGQVGSPGFCCGAVQVLEPGKPIGQFYTLQSEGIDANGVWKNRDINGDGNINESDRTVTGQAQPNLFLGWDNTLHWKRFTMNVFWRGVFGHDQFNIFNLFYGNPQALKFSPFNIPKQSLEGDLARLSTANVPLSDYFIESSSFLRLENLSLGYDVPLAQSESKRNLHLYLSTQNLLTFTSFSGNDPEVQLKNINAPLVPGMIHPNYWSLEPRFQGVDRSRYPLTRSLVLGLRLQW